MKIIPRLPSEANIRWTDKTHRWNNLTNKCLKKPGMSPNCLVTSED